MPVSPPVIKTTCVLMVRSFCWGAAGSPTATHILCSGFSPRSLVELSAEHWQTTLRFCASRLILEDIPVLGQHTVGDPYDVSGDPVPRASQSREPSMDYDKVAVGRDHARFVFERRGSALD